MHYTITDCKGYMGHCHKIGHYYIPEPFPLGAFVVAASAAILLSSVAPSSIFTIKKTLSRAVISFYIG